MGALDRNGLVKLPCSQENLQTQYFLLKCKYSLIIILRSHQIGLF